MRDRSAMISRHSRDRGLLSGTLCCPARYRMTGTPVTPLRAITPLNNFGGAVLLWSIACQFTLSSKVEVANLVICRSGVPHPPLRIGKEFPHGIFGVRKRIFEDIAGLRIQTADHVRVLGRIPELVILSDVQSVGSGIRTGQLVFDELFCLRIEMGKFSDVIFGKPDGSIGVHLNAPIENVLFRTAGWRSPFLHVAGF